MAISESALIVHPFKFPHADMLVAAIHKGERITFRISSSALIKQGFLKPPYRAEKGNDVPQIDFTKDNGDALLILLNINTAGSCVLCNRYDCHGLIQPWLNNWTSWRRTEWRNSGLDPAANRSSPSRQATAGISNKKITMLAKDDRPSARKNQRKWIFIAWTFGLEEDFEELTQEWLREATVGENDGLIELESLIQRQSCPVLCLQTSSVGLSMASAHD
ncbi:hypothetical protein B0O99DRAFT_735491 [Bisporella sp. PMI_857]|nr:hypothetical protein B0O99DRAFT_735491 [Bisporella sp. PMI_857]